MIQVASAEEIINSVTLEISTVEIPISEAVGRVLREPITSDRDLPPFDRVMMDGIAIQYDQWEGGQRLFPIEGFQKANAPKRSLAEAQNSLEVMTAPSCQGIRILLSGMKM